MASAVPPAEFFREPAALPRLRPGAKVPHALSRPRTRRQTASKSPGTSRSLWRGHQDPFQPFRKGQDEGIQDLAHKVQLPWYLRPDRVIGLQIELARSDFRAGQIFCASEISGATKRAR